MDARLWSNMEYEGMYDMGLERWEHENFGGAWIVRVTDSRHYIYLTFCSRILGREFPRSIRPLSDTPFYEQTSPQSQKIPTGTKETVHLKRGASIASIIMKVIWFIINNFTHYEYICKQRVEIKWVGSHETREGKLLSVTQGKDTLVAGHGKQERVWFLYKRLITELGVVILGSNSHAC